MNRDSCQQQFAIRELWPGSALIRDVGTLKDPMAERVRQVVLRLMKVGTPDEMDQKELVQRCASPYVRIDQVHKLVKGDLQFPPLSFLDTVLKSFGSSLVEALEKDPPSRPLPILRADVRVAAQLLEKRSGPYVESLTDLLQATARERSRARRAGKRRGA